MQILTGGVGEIGRYLGEPNEQRVLEITDYLSLKAREGEQRANPGRAINQDQSDRAVLNLLQNILIILQNENNRRHAFVRYSLQDACDRSPEGFGARESEPELDEILRQLGGVETLIRQVYETGYMVGGKRRRRTGKKSRRRKPRRRKSRKKKSRKSRRKKY